MKVPTFLKIFFLCAALLTIQSKGYSQQLLWTTASDAKEKKIPKSQVINEILKQYDFYEYYVDATGFTRESFTSKLKEGKGDKGATTSKDSKVDSRLAGIKEPTIFAWKDNTGSGSLVIVLSVNGDNIDMLVFSNQIEFGSISTSEYDRNKFSKWLKSIYNLESNEKPDIKTYKNNPTDYPTDADLIPQLPTTISPDEPVQSVAVKAAFPGGESAFRDFVANEFQYPKRCQDERIQGSVVLRFVVNQSGRISRVSAIQETKSCPEFTEEAIRVIKRSPRWIPGQNNGRFVTSWREIPMRLSTE